MPSCVACKNNSKSAKGKGVSFFRFPCDPQRRDAWVEEIGLKDWIPNSFSRICSDHFEECCFENSVPDMRQRTQLKKFSIPTLFDEILDQRRSKRKRKKRKNLILAPKVEVTSDPIKPVEPVLHSVNEKKPDEDIVEVRLIFPEKRQIETNEKPSASVSAVARKKFGRKRKPKKVDDDGGATVVASAAASPAKRNALEEYKEKCGVGLSDEKISSMKLISLIPREHNYFVHESAKLLKIKLTQAQEELLEVKQKLEKCKQALRLERRKRVRSLEKTRKLATSLNGIKVESHKQKQIINKFSNMLDADACRATKSFGDDRRLFTGIVDDFDEASIRADDVDDNDDENAMLGYELVRKFAPENLSGHGTAVDLRNFASTLKKISPKAFEFVRSTISGAELQLQPDLETKVVVREKHRKAKKKAKSKHKLPRKTEDYEQVMSTELSSEHLSASGYLGQLKQEVVDFRIVQDAGLEEADQFILSSEVPQFEFVPQTYEVVPTSLSAGNEPGAACVYYTYDPNLSQFNSFSWT